MHLLRREVELPPRLHQRVWFYLALASFSLSLSIILDAALWARPSIAVERAVTVRRLHLRAPCRARAVAPPPPAHPAHPGEYHDELMNQLAHQQAAFEDVDPRFRRPGTVPLTATENLDRSWHGELATGGGSEAVVVHSAVHADSK